MRIWKKERTVADLFRRHAEAVDRCVDGAKTAVLAYLAGDSILEAAKNVDRLESEADHLCGEIRDVLYEGAFLPLLREDLYELNHRVDAVANAAESAVQFLSRQQPDIPEALRPDFRQLTEAAAAAMQPLAEAIDAYFKPKGKVKSIRESAHEVQKRESAADVIEENLTRAIFATSLPLERKLHIQRAVEVVAKLADRAENAADRLQQVSLKSLV